MIREQGFNFMHCNAAFLESVNVTIVLACTVFNL